MIQDQATSELGSPSDGPKVVSPLRVARQGRGLSLHAIANRIGFDPSYVSLIENGKKKPSEKFLVIYARKLGFPDEHFLSLLAAHTGAPSQADTLIHLLKNFALYDSASANTAFRQLAERFTDHRKLSVADHASYLFFRALQLPQEKSDLKHLISSRSSRGAYATFDQDILNCYAPLCCERAIPFWILFRPNFDATIAHEYFSDVKFILQFQLPFINTENIFVESIPDMHPGIFPIDFHLAIPQASVMMMGNTPFQVSDHLRFDKDVEKLLSFFEMMRAYGERKVSFFRHNKLMQFHEQSVKLQSSTQKRSMAQRFLGAFTRPPSDFRPGSDWWIHYANQDNCSAIDIDRFAELRLQMNRVSRGDSCGVRQICSRQAIESWAHTGVRSDKPAAPLWHEKNRERLARLDYLRYLLENKPSFDIAVIDDSQGGPLGWNATNQARDLSWVVEGRAGIAFETTYEKPTTETGKEFQVIIQSQAIADDFSAHFDGVWNRLPPRSKDRSSILGWVSSVRSQIQ